MVVLSLYNVHVLGTAYVCIEKLSLQCTVFRIKKNYVWIAKLFNLRMLEGMF